MQFSVTASAQTMSVEEMMSRFEKAKKSRGIEGDHLGLRKVKRSVAPPLAPARQSAETVPAPAVMPAPIPAAVPTIAASAPPPVLDVAAPPVAPVRQSVETVPAPAAMLALTPAAMPTVAASVPAPTVQAAPAPPLVFDVAAPPAAPIRQSVETVPAPAAMLALTPAAMPTVAASVPAPTVQAASAPPLVFDVAAPAPVVPVDAPSIIEAATASEMYEATVIAASDVDPVSQPVSALPAKSYETAPIASVKTLDSVVEPDEGIFVSATDNVLQNALVKVPVVDAPTPAFDSATTTVIATGTVTQGAVTGRAEVASLLQPPQSPVTKELFLSEDFSVASYRPLPEDERVAIPIQFEKNSAALTPTTIADLKQVCAAMKGMDISQFLVVGHTDKSGESAFNDYLSLARANEVRRHMIEECSLDPTKLVAVGVGERFANQSSSRAEAEQERRVEFEPIS